jgi:hypothetical protein
LLRCAALLLPGVAANGVARCCCCRCGTARSHGSERMVLVCMAEAARRAEQLGFAAGGQSFGGQLASHSPLERRAR